MDYFGSSDNRLGTTGINTCIGFIVIFNHGGHVFIEHRTAIHFPSQLSISNIRSFFKNIVEHIDLSRKFSKQYIQRLTN
jgi:hypothetical protein